MAYALKLIGASGATYTFERTWHPADASVSNAVPVAKLPRTHGARVTFGYRQARRLVIQGGLLKGPIGGVTDFSTSIEALRAALQDAPFDLYFGEDGWYYTCCQCEDFREPYDGSSFGRLLAGGEIVMVAGDPFRYATQLNTDSWGSPAGTRTITVGGNAPAAPTFAIQIGGSGAVTLAMTLSNDTTNEELTLGGAVTGGDVIEVDTLAKTVEIASVDKRTLFDGPFPGLAVGANEIAIDVTSGTLTNITTTWRNRRW